MGDLTFWWIPVWWLVKLRTGVRERRAERCFGWQGGRSLKSWKWSVKMKVGPASGMMASPRFKSLFLFPNYCTLGVDIWPGTVAVRQLLIATRIHSVNVERCLNPMSVMYTVLYSLPSYRFCLHAVTRKLNDYS